MTNSKIYYSPYNPIHYGTSPRGGEVYDYIGGKIYVTDRDDPKESELIFDCGREFAFPNGYTMIGDYLYFDCMQIIRQGDYAWFSSALELKKVRINIKEHTIKYLSFD